MTTPRHGYPEAFMLAVELLYDECTKQGHENLREHGGLLEVQFGVWPRIWHVATHAQDEPIEHLKSGTVRVMFNGWPAGIIDAAGGVIAHRLSGNESNLIDDLKRELDDRGVVVEVAAST